MNSQWLPEDSNSRSDSKPHNKQILQYLVTLEAGEHFFPFF